MSPSPSSLAPPPHLTVRIARGLALLGLTLGLGLVGSLFIFTFFPSLHQLAWELADPNQSLPSIDAGIPIALALLVLTPLGIGYAFRRTRAHSIRDWVVFALIVATVLVANLVVVAIFPSGREGIEVLFGLSFWKVSGPVVASIGGTLLAIGVAAWRLRPSSLRGMVQFGLALGFILTLDLVLVAFFPSILDGLQGPRSPYFAVDGNRERFGHLVLALVLIGLTPAFVLIAAWRLRLHSWRWIGGGYLLLAPLLAYLATDDPVIRRPMTMDEIAPAFPGAEQSHEVLMRYGKSHPLGRGFKPPSRIWTKPTAPGEAALDPGKPDRWLAWLKGHRSEIEGDWAELAPVRAWWAELNAFDRLGDLTPPRYDAEIMGFSPPRAMCQFGCSIAGLQALDGHGDEAIDTLLPILQVGRKLQSSARTLVREMIAIVIERMSLQTAGFILDQATVSPPVRARLIAALAASGGGPAGGRRLMAIEYAFHLNYAVGKTFGDLVVSENSPWLRHGLNAISPFIFNPRATFNLLGDFVADEQEIVANRQLDRLDARMRLFATEDARPRFKNFAGALLVRAATPAMIKVASSYWNTQDMRTALLARTLRSGSAQQNESKGRPYAHDQTPGATRSGTSSTLATGS